MKFLCLCLLESDNRNRSGSWNDKSISASLKLLNLGRNGLAAYVTCCNRRSRSVISCDIFKIGSKPIEGMRRLRTYFILPSCNTLTSAPDSFACKTAALKGGWREGGWVCLVAKPQSYHQINLYMLTGFLVIPLTLQSVASFHLRHFPLVAIEWLVFRRALVVVHRPLHWFGTNLVDTWKTL